jgi:hypothetical protein
MNKGKLFAYISVLLASDVLNIVLQPTLQLPMVTFRTIHVGLLLLLLLISYFRFKSLIRLNLLLTVVNIGYLITSAISTNPQYPQWFAPNSFVGQIGGSILLKAVTALLVVFILLVILPKQTYLTLGNLKVKADKIGWLGIDAQSISWGRLSVISALLISLGTFVGTVVTVTGFSFVRNLESLLPLLPFILIFAMGNAMFEGIIYRNAVLSSLKGILEKNDIVMLGAIFFGIAHYYGAPGGIIGVLMSSALGWYLCRSMIETEGLFSSWLMHFFQDVVIFSALILLGGFGL